MFAPPNGLRFPPITAMEELKCDTHTSEPENPSNFVELSRLIHPLYKLAYVLNTIA